MQGQCQECFVDKIQEEFIVHETCNCHHCQFGEAYSISAVINASFLGMLNWMLVTSVQERMTKLRTIRNHHKFFLYCLLPEMVVATDSVLLFPLHAPSGLLVQRCKTCCYVAGSVGSPLWNVATFPIYIVDSVRSPSCNVLGHARNCLIAMVALFSEGKFLSDWWQSCHFAMGSHMAWRVSSFSLTFLDFQAGMLPPFATFDADHGCLGFIIFLRDKLLESMAECLVRGAHWSRFCSSFDDQLFLDFLALLPCDTKRLLGRCGSNRVHIPSASSKHPVLK